MIAAATLRAFPVRRWGERLTGRAAEPDPPVAPPQW